MKSVVSWLTKMTPTTCPPGWCEWPLDREGDDRGSSDRRGGMTGMTLLRGTTLRGFTLQEVQQSGKCSRSPNECRLLGFFFPTTPPTARSLGWCSNMVPGLSQLPCAILGKGSHSTQQRLKNRSEKGRKTHPVLTSFTFHF